MTREWKASELDSRCSEACVRAGLTALLFSALAFSMLQPIARQKALDALGDYVGLRVALKATLDELDGEECWQSLNRSELGVSKWTISKLKEYVCTAMSQEPITKAEQAAPPSDPPRPAAPTNLRITFPLYQAATIANLLTGLNSSNLLSLARSVSSRFNYSIYRWIILREQIVTKNYAINGIATAHTGNEENDQEYYLPTYSREELLQLTLENVKELAAYELPDISEIEPPLREEKRFTLSTTAPPLTLISAITFVSFVLFFSLAYFWFFLYEARRSDTFLTPGTLFGVLNRTRISRRMLFMLMITPAVSIIFLTWFSLDLLLYTSSPKPISNVIVAGLNIFITFLVLRFTELIAREFWPNYLRTLFTLVKKLSPAWF